MNSRLKTLHIELGNHLYGGALQALYLMMGLMDRGHEASLICPRGSAIEDEARKASIAVYPIPVIVDFDPGIAARAYSVIRRVNPDVVHLHSRRGGDIFGGLAARLALVPAVILSRRVDDRIRFIPAGRIKYLLPHKVVAISDGIRKVLHDSGVKNGRVELVHSGIVPSEFRLERDRAWFEREFGIAQDSIVIATIAQLIDRKGHRYLLDVVPEILARFPSAKFLLLGTGPSRVALENRVRSLGMQEHVIFAGFRTDIKRILPNLDLVVHPAIREGLGVSLLQAAAAGLPIVATAVGGIPEIVIDGSTGFLVPPADSAAISKSVLTLLSDPGLAGRMAENARKLVESEFSVNQMVEGNLRVYREALLSVSDGHKQEKPA